MRLAPLAQCFVEVGIVGLKAGGCGSFYRKGSVRVPFLSNVGLSKVGFFFFLRMTLF
jgi:hypothetical protein